MRRFTVHNNQVGGIEPYPMIHLNTGMTEAKYASFLPDPNRVILPKWPSPTSIYKQGDTNEMLRTKYEQAWDDQITRMATAGYPHSMSFHGNHKTLFRQVLLDFARDRGFVRPWTVEFSTDLGGDWIGFQSRRDMLVLLMFVGTYTPLSFSYLLDIG